MACQLLLASCQLWITRCYTTIGKGLSTNAHQQYM